ncbi:hypothetical protein M406DRAFT_245744 [Cryphonectria parasitica EP155]|uniref:Zn(2)-C6 fungal-type domain-containing protein n=1 Tax=Cryphonectria parasitica (strain ATCC 38755 / EP155) TaxID=660469 RepID=A0A9P4YD59_CRYP1|nr:uncharacterized protein M406DRAFT_245744 [Cryphonectria parasitica EP155]KAF3770804.1 hypothetical protein M406DRAFT_245744 [Cryphonectria parasitica EP155]
MAPELTSHRRTGAPSPAPTVDSSTSSSTLSHDAQRQRRPRTSKPKVKTGCSNCKQRRIKCDEKRPACSNCVRSKKNCSGYPPPSRSARPFEEIPILPRPRPTDGSAATAPQTIRPTQSIQLPPRRVAKQQRRNTPPQERPFAQQQHQLHHQQQQQQHHQHHQQQQQQQNAITLYRPTTFPFAQQEGLYFQLFQSHTASELSGYFDSVFWSRLVLQECHSAVAIRHAVVALGALYKTLEKNSESPPTSPRPGVDYVDSAYRHWEVAVRSYSSACTSLVGVAGSDNSANRTRLMASVLLACFDSFIGDHKQAIKQIQTGLSLLEQLRAQRRRAFMAHPEEPVEDEIIQMFTRLAIQAKSYDMAFHFPKPYVVRLIQPSTDPSSPQSDGGSPVSLHQDPIPDRFASLHEARIAWDTLCERMFRFTETLFSTASQNGPMGILPATLHQYGLGFRGQIESWSQAFDHILTTRSAPGVISQEKAAIAVLKMSQLMGQVLFSMTFSDSEGHFDKFEPQFQKIVDLGREVVGDQERRAAEKRCPDPRTCRHFTKHVADIFGGHEYTATHIKPSFSADMGIVPPLYVVATKCRNPLIRRQAIQLLRSSSRREAMWDSELTARIGSWIMDIEEEEDLEALTPGRSSLGSFSDASGRSPLTAYTSGGSPRPHSSYSNGSVEFGNNLGPGGNAKWDARRGSTVSQANRVQQKVVPHDKRVMVMAVEFNLREHNAVLQCGSRGITAGTPDLKTRVTQITW